MMTEQTTPRSLPKKHDTRSHRVVLKCSECES